MAAGDSTKAVVTALFANLGVAVAKFVGFLLTGASSMLAESIHSVADSSNQGLLLLGGHRARREPSEMHPFGYGRVRYFWSFVVAVVLFALGSLFALFEGFQKLRDPHELEAPVIAAGILVVGLVLEGFALRTAVVAADRARGDDSWWAFIRRSRSPELPVILLEDLGAMIGLTFALLAVGLSWVTGDAVYDAFGTLAIGALLGVISAVLAVEMKSLLIGESARASDIVAIRNAITGDDRVHGLFDLRTQHIGPEELLVAGKVQLAPTLDFDGVVAVIDEAERRVRDAVPMAHVIYIEPDRDDDPPDGHRPAAGAGADATTDHGE